MNPLVSIVVPCYNDAHYLPDCLASIFAQQGGMCGRLYARQFVDAGEKYLWFGNYADARRSYLAALRADAAQGLNTAVLRHSLGTLIARALYESFKRAVHRVRRA